MEKLFCDECGKEIKSSLAFFDHVVKDKEAERETRITIQIEGQTFGDLSDHDVHPKNFPIEHLCKTCAIKYAEAGLAALKTEYEWDNKS